MLAQMVLFSTKVTVVDFAFIDWEYDLKQGVWDVKFDPIVAKNRIVSLNMCNNNPNMVVWNWAHWSNLGKTFWIT